MKTKKYRVWISHSCPVDIEAKNIKIISIDDEPKKIIFLGNDHYTIAEFYCDMISGWAQIDSIIDYNIEKENKMKLQEVIETLQTWINESDDEFDREEQGRVAGLKMALHEIEKIE